MSRRSNILEYALGSLLRRRAKSLAIVLVYAAAVAAVASVLLFSRALRTESSLLLRGAPEIVVQRLLAGRHAPVPEEYAAAIAAMPGVAAVAPRHWGYLYDALAKANVTVMGAAAPGPALPTLRGRLPARPGEAALGDGYARARRLDIDHDLILVDALGTGRSFTVTGVFTAESALLTNDLVLLDPADVRELFALPEGQATDLAVSVRNPREVATVAAKTRARLPDTRPVTREDLQRTYAAVFDWRSGMLLAALVPALAAFVVLAWDRASGISAEEQREIGVLKAVGWAPGDILLLKSLEGAVLSSLALLLGVLIAQAHLTLFGGAPLTGMLAGWSVLYPPFPLDLAPDPFTIAALAVLTVVPYTAATLVPAWRSAVAEPDSVLRG